MVFPILGSGDPSSGYNIANSCRFNSGDSAYMHITYSGGASNLKTYTVSFWVKRAKLGARQSIFNNTDAGGQDGVYYDFYADDTLAFLDYGTGSYLTPRFETTQVFRDTSAWYHIVYAVDTTQSTEANRVKIYVNGTRVTAFDVENYPDEDADTLWNRADKLSIGTYTAGGNYFGGYLAEVVHIDGSQLAPTSFGEFDEDSGIWKPIDVSELTFGDNGFYLDFEDSGDLDDDESGEGNDFTAVNLAATDQTTDTPTNNFATANPLDVRQGATFSEGNCKIVTNSSNRNYVISTIGVTSGKWYCEAKITDGNTNAWLGVADFDDLLDSSSSTLGDNSNEIGLQYQGTYQKNNSNTTDWSDSFADDDIIGVLIDLDNNRITYHKNGSYSDGSGNFDESSPTAYISFTNSTMGFAFGDGAGAGTSTYEINFGNPPFAISSGNADANGYGNFEYAPPSGYYALCTKNLAEFG